MIVGVPRGWRAPSVGHCHRHAFKAFCALPSDREGQPFQSTGNGAIVKTGFGQGACSPRAHSANFSLANEAHLPAERMLAACLRFPILASYLLGGDHDTCSSIVA